MRTSESITELVPALAAARKNFGAIRKENVAQIGANRIYMYADLAAVLEIVVPPLLEHGLVLVQTVEPDTSSLLTRLVHTSGQWIESAYPLQLDQQPQQLGTAITYGRRYSVVALLSVAAEDDDGAAAAAPAPKPRAVQKQAPPPSKPAPPQAPSPTQNPISPAQRTRLWAIVNEHKWSREEFKAWLKAKHQLESTEFIPVDLYDTITKQLEAGPPVPADFAF